MTTRREMQITLEDNVLREALVEAQKRGITLDEFVDYALSEAVKMNDSAQLPSNPVGTTVDRAKALKKGNHFSVPELWEETEWERLPSGVRKSIGKNFRRIVEDPNAPIARHIGKTQTNQAIYERV